MQGQRRFCPGADSTYNSSRMSSGNDANGKQCARLAGATSVIPQVWPLHPSQCFLRSNLSCVPGAPSSFGSCLFSVPNIPAFLEILWVSNNLFWEILFVFSSSKKLVLVTSKRNSDSYMAWIEKFCSLDLGIPSEYAWFGVDFTSREMYQGQLNFSTAKK